VVTDCKKCIDLLQRLLQLQQMQSKLPVGEKEVSLQEIWNRFEFVLGLFGIVLQGGYLYGAWPRTVLILIQFGFIVPKS